MTFLSEQFIIAISYIWRCRHGHALYAAGTGQNPAASEKAVLHGPLWDGLEDSERDWARFRAAQPAEVGSQVLDLLDRRDGMWTVRQDAAFCLGLQLGMELGRLEEFWDEEV